MTKCPSCGCEFENDELISAPTDAEEIYKLYPAARRIAKQKTLAAIRRALKRVPFQELKRRTAAFLVCWDNADLTFCPTSLTWFGQQRFDDPPESWVPTKKPRSNGPPTWRLIAAKQERIDQHPANPNYIGYDIRKVTDAMRENLRALRSELAKLKDQSGSEL